MYITLGVTRQTGKGSHEFFKEFEKLMQSATTWKVESAEFTSATIQSTATIPSLPDKPRWKLKEHSVYSGTVVVELLDKEWTHDQKAHAAENIVYLGLTALAPYVNKIEILATT